MQCLQWLEESRDVTMKYLYLILTLFLFMGSPVFAQPDALTVICDNWPPYQVTEDKRNVSGFSTEVVRTVLARMNMRIESLTVYPWKRALKNIEAGTADALFSANFRKDRAEFAWYPDEPIVNSRWVIWSIEGSDNIYTSLNDLTGKTVGVVSGYSYTKDFWRFVREKGLFFESIDDATNFKMLKGGRFEYVLAELENGKHVLKELGINDVIPHKEHPVKLDGLYIIFSKQTVTKDFVDSFSEELRKFKKEPAYQEIGDTYFK